MKQRRVIVISSCLMLFFSVSLSCYPAYGAAGKPITVGEILPEFTLTAPGSKEVQQYLGLKDAAPFSLLQVPAKLLLVEIFSTLCTTCMKSAPGMNKLYKFIRNDQLLSNDIKMIGIGVGDK